MTTIDVQARSAATALSLGEWAVSAVPEEVLACVGLGSCIAVTMHDPVAVVGAMAHMVLPDSSAGRPGATGAKFVDLAIPLLLEQVAKAGASPGRLRVCLAGGAQMLQASSIARGAMNVGQRNAEAAEAALAALGLAPARSDVGGNRGRTVRLHIGTGRVTVAVPGEREVEL